jgi:hypothetical protein
MDPYLPPPGSLGISQVLTSSRSHLSRLTPAQAFTYLSHHPSTPTSTRTENEPTYRPGRHTALAQRLTEGQIDGALIVERNVLEWRFDPRSEARLDIAGRYDLRVIVICQEGYTSMYILIAFTSFLSGLVGCGKTICSRVIWLRSRALVLWLVKLVLAS